jgi:hypothetical protein
MPRWLPVEIQQISDVTTAIGRYSGPRRRPPLRSPLDLALSAAIPLLNGLGAGTRAVLVRQFLRALGFDERRFLPWRLEHKLIQAHVLESYIPGIVPVTSGLDARIAGVDPARIRESLASEFPSGFLIKRALGESSGESMNSDRSEEILHTLDRGVTAKTPPRLIEERFIVQERIEMANEYRVHTLEDLVIDDLTFHRFGFGSIPGERDAPNAFVQSVLNCLPDGLIGGSLLAWDIAMKPDGTFIIIEVNFSGFQPDYNKGFHCSGFYHDAKWGACDTARLLNHVARLDGVDITVRADALDHPLENQFYADTAGWQRRHSASRAQVQAR